MNNDKKMLIITKCGIRSLGDFIIGIMNMSYEAGREKEHKHNEKKEVVNE